MTSQKLIRVLVVDDSGLVRDLISSILASERDITIVGEASNGMDAFEKVVALKPDIVTMDIEMPVLGGLEAIEKIMAEHPLPILVITALTGVRTAFAAVSKGALDVIEKPDISIDNVRKLISKVRMLSRVDIKAHLATMGKSTTSLPQKDVVAVANKHTAGDRLLAIASSTGGPQAIYKILSALPQNFPAPVVITQHIAEGFTQGMADWLSGGTALSVKVAAHGDHLRPGQVYINPAEHSMTISGHSIVIGKQDEKSIFHPSCNTMLSSVAHAYRGRAIGLILSGMGNDGVEGMRAIKTAGGATLAQDAKSSVVFGMNKVAVDKGYVDLVLPLAEIAGGLMTLVGRK